MAAASEQLSASIAEISGQISQSTDIASGAAREAEETNQKIEHTIRSIKESQADKQKTKIVRSELESFKKTVKPAKPKVKAAAVQLEEGEIGVGSYVRVKGQPTMGEVLAIKGKDAEIRIGALTSKVKINRLEKISRKSFRAGEAGQETGSVKTGFDMTEKNMAFQSRIDIRGKRTEEALGEVDRFVDHGLLVGAKELIIVHGKGDGILREMVRKHLRGYPQVNNIHDAHADRGGAGITIFELN